MTRSKHGPAPTTLRGKATRRSITVHLSPAEYAAAELAAGGEPMATWARGVVVRAVKSQMVPG